MEYSVEEIPAASWRPGLPQALACYRIVHEVAGTILETPDASETDERNAFEIVSVLNNAAQMYRALDLIRSMATANIPPSERLADIAKWAEEALQAAQPGEES